MKLQTSLTGALAALAIAAPAAGAHNNLPDAEIFATNNTAVITDPDDPRLRDRLKGFAREVEDIVDDGGGDPRGSELLDGVFFSSDLGTTTFERSRRFDVDDVADDQLHSIADRIRSRFGQQSVLTFDHLPKGDDEADAILLEVPSVKAQDLREGLLADQTAREELFGGSVTLDGRLLLVAELADAQLARDFAKRIGGDTRRAVVHYGEREFVEGPAARLRRPPHADHRGHPGGRHRDAARALGPARGRPRRRALRGRSQAVRSRARGPRRWARHAGARGLGGR